MADQQTDLQIVIEAVNKASAQLKQVEKDLGGLTGAVKSQGSAAGVASMGVGKLAAGVAIGGVVAQVAMIAFEKLSGAITGAASAFYNIAKTASEIEGIGVAMHIVANNAGVTADQVDKVRDSVIEQNVTTEAANRLMVDLIRNQLDYAQATEIASAAQNIAVASGVSSSETIERISEAVSSGNTWNLRQLGLVEHLDKVYERYGETLNKTSDEMTEQERKQAIVNYVLQEGVKYAGAYDAAMTNASKVMRSTSDRVKEISYQFGKVFEPALYEAAKAVYDVVNSIVKWTKTNEDKLRAIAKAVGVYFKGVVDAVRSFVASIPWGAVLDGLSFVIRQVMQFAASLKIVFNVIQIAARGVQSFANTVVDAGKALQAFIQRDWNALRKVGRDWVNEEAAIGEAIIGDIQDIGDAFKNSYDSQTFDLENWWNDVQAIEGSGWEDRLKMAEEQGDKLSKEQLDKLKKMARDIEKENRDYAQAVAKRASDFTQSFEDLVLSHRDKIQEMTDDLATQNRDYKKDLLSLLSDYNESMTDIETRHKDKTKSVTDDMEEEKKKTLEAIEEITEKYNEERTLIEREGEDRLSTLQAQLDQELALGSNANQQKIDSLRQMILYEQTGLQTSLDEKKAVYDEEVDDLNTALDDKLAKLQEELDAEDLAYTTSFAKRKAEYEQDVLDAREAYEEKRKDTQDSLDKELAIQQKYADDFSRLKDRVADDDITRLIQTFNTEKSEMEREHGERLADIKYQAFEGGEEFGASFASGFDSSYPEVKSRLNQMSNDISSVIGKYNTLNDKASSAGRVGDFYTPSNYPGGNYPYFGAKGGLFSKPTTIGEAGAEVVLPLSFPKRMAQIMQSLGMNNQGGGAVTQNFYVTVQNSQDVDLMMERASFAMKTGGGYR